MIRDKLFQAKQTMAQKDSEDGDDTLFCTGFTEG